MGVNRNYTIGQQAKLRGDHLKVKVSVIAPDPENYKQMTPGEFVKLVESIRRHGFIEPLVVREKPNKKAGTAYETINGAHRLQAAKDLELPEIPCVNVGKVTEEEAYEIGVILNELHGSPDQVRLADRLRRISETMPFEKLAAVMPYSRGELQMYLDSVDFNWSNLSGEDQRPPPEPGETPDEKRLVFKFTTKRADKLLAILEQIDPDTSRALEQVVLEHAKQNKIRPTTSKKSSSKKVPRRRPKKAAAS